MKCDHITTKKYFFLQKKVLFLSKKKYFYLQKKVLFFGKKKYFFLAKKSTSRHMQYGALWNGAKVLKTQVYLTYGCLTPNHKKTLIVMVYIPFNAMVMVPENQ